MSPSVRAWPLLLVIALAAPAPVHFAQAQAGSPPPQAMQDYSDTVSQADGLVAAGNAFEAVRLYERAARIAYNNKLPTDAAALSAKLAAARAARDTKAAAPTPAPAPPAPATSAATSAANAPAPATANAGARVAEEDDPNAWISYGDGLVKVGAYGDAVLAYERARRLSTNSRIPIDRAAVDAKIAAAAQARDAPHGPGELIPEPPPPAPRTPGYKPDISYLPDRPGKILPWTLHYEPFVKADTHATDAELKAFDANLHKAADVLTKAPVLSPPIGFEFRVHAALSGFNAEKKDLAAHLPLRTWLEFVGLSYYYFEKDVTKKVFTPGEPSCVYHLVVNDVPLFNSGSGGGRLKYGDDEYFLEPRKDGELAGLPVYNDHLVIAKPGALLWKPVSMELALKALMPTLKQWADDENAAIEKRKKAYADYMNPEAQEKRRREVAAQRAAGAEANAHKLEVMQHRWEEDARKESESAKDTKFKGQIDAYQTQQAMLAALTPEGRSAPACMTTGKRQEDVNEWRVVPMGTSGCRPVVRSNPDLLNGKLPRSELQILTLAHVAAVNREFGAISKASADNSAGECAAAARILRQTDWKQFVGLLAN